MREHACSICATALAANDETFTGICVEFGSVRSYPLQGIPAVVDGSGEDVFGCEAVIDRDADSIVTLNELAGTGDGLGGAADAVAAPVVVDDEG